MSKSYNIAVIPGDGTGPEVVREGKKVLSAVASKFGFKLNYEEFDFGGEGILKLARFCLNPHLSTLRSSIQSSLAQSAILMSDRGFLKKVYS